MTTFTRTALSLARPLGQTLGPRDGDHELRAPLRCVRELGADLGGEVPREDQNEIGTRLGNYLRRVDRDLGAGCVLALLVGAPIDRVPQKSVRMPQ